MPSLWCNDRYGWVAMRSGICPECGGNVFDLHGAKPIMIKCRGCGHEEKWRPGAVTCLVCEKDIRKDQRGYALYGYSVHKKCMIEYTAWENEREHPGASAGESRILQVRRNLEHLYSSIEKKRILRGELVA